MELNPAAFNALLHGARQDLAWRKAWPCPCVDGDTDSPRDGCPLCFGKGWQWDCETPAWAAVQNQTSKKVMADFGTWEQGDVVITIPEDSPLYDCGRNDRIRVLNSTNAFGDVLRRGFTDRILGTVTEIRRVFWINDAGDARVEGKIPGVGPNGELTWPDGGGPPNGKHYTVVGERYDEYFVFPALPTDRRMHAGARLPRKLLARRFDIFGR